MIIQNISEAISDKLGCEFYTSGMTIFGSKKVDDPKKSNLIFCTKEKVNGTSYSVKLKYDHQIILEDLFSLDSSVNKAPAIQFLDILVKSMMRDMKFVEIGRNSQFFL